MENPCLCFSLYFSLSPLFLEEECGGGVRRRWGVGWVFKEAWVGSWRIYDISTSIVFVHLNFRREKTFLIGAEVSRTGRCF